MAKKDRYELNTGHNPNGRMTLIFMHQTISGTKELVSLDNESKQEWITPQLVDYGDVAQLTKFENLNIKHTVQV